MFQVEKREWMKRGLNFDNIGSALLTLFAMLTGEGWQKLVSEKLRIMLMHTHIYAYTHTHLHTHTHTHTSGPPLLMTLLPTYFVTRRNY